MNRSVGRLLALSLCCWVFLAVGGRVVAHSEFQSAEPPPGAQLAAAPRDLQLTFTEPLSTTSRAFLYAENFQPIAGVASVIDANDPHRLIVQTPPLEPGVYTVQWLAVGADGHALRGSYQLAVREQAVGPVLWWVAAVVGLLALLATLFFWRRRQNRRLPQVA
jgi:methionine-rich copper-binding protein CopC